MKEQSQEAVGQKDTLVVRVSNALREAIRSGDFQPGDKLPSEAQLTESHNVSRTVVREAIASLRADGLVQPRRGAGVFILEPVIAPTLPFQGLDPAKLSSTLELLELRTAVEVEAAGLAAQRRSPVQEEEIVEKHNAVQASIEAGTATSVADFALHLAIAEATHNRRFVEFLKLLGEAAIPRAALRSSQEDRASADYLAKIHEEHARIVWAISGGDAAGASQAMRAHLVGSQARYRALLHQRQS